MRELRTNNIEKDQSSTADALIKTNVWLNRQPGIRTRRGLARGTASVSGQPLVGITPFMPSDGTGSTLIIDGSGTVSGFSSALSRPLWGDNAESTPPVSYFGQWYAFGGRYTTDPQTDLAFINRAGVGNNQKCGTAAAGFTGTTNFEEIALGSVGALTPDGQTVLQQFKWTGATSNVAIQPAVEMRHEDTTTSVTLSLGRIRDGIMTVLQSLTDTIAPGAPTVTFTSSVFEIKYNDRVTAWVTRNNGVTGTGGCSGSGQHFGTGSGAFYVYGEATLPPTLTSATTSSAYELTAYSFTVTATYGVWFSASGLPTGLSINSTTGVISGTPSTVGVYPVAVTTRNQAGSDSGILTITVLAEWPPGGIFPAGWVTPSLASNGWSVSPTDGVGGSSCLVSDPIADGEAADMAVAINCGNGDLTFDYKVSSEQSYDYLKFYFDGVLIAQWSGSVGWSTYTYPVTAGVHTFRWAYVKDSSIAVGSDAGYIDNVSIPSP